jgi:hypothetical protein
MRASLEQCQQILGGRSVSGTCVANPAWSETTGAGWIGDDRRRRSKLAGSPARQPRSSAVTRAVN